jgi:hypothetical protein
MLPLVDAEMHPQNTRTGLIQEFMPTKNVDSKKKLVDFVNMISL